MLCSRLSLQFLSSGIANLRKSMGIPGAVIRIAGRNAVAAARIPGPWDSIDLPAERYAALDPCKRCRDSLSNLRRAMNRRSLAADTGDREWHPG